MTLSQDDIMDRIDYAKGIHSEAVKFMKDVEDLYTGDFVVESDKKDPKIVPFVPSKARAILSKLLAMLAMRAELNMEVIPNKVAKAEDEICTKLERWLDGYQALMGREYRRMPSIYLRWKFWFLFRGRGDLELKYYPDLAKKGVMPLRVRADDPMVVFPVWGDFGPVFYAKIYKIPAFQLSDEFARGFSLWKIPSNLSEKGLQDEVEIKEYWDADWHAAYVDDQEVYSKPNPFGFMPLVEAQAEATPLADMEWAYQSVLFPIMNALKHQATLLGKIGTAVELFYWPEFLGRDSGGMVHKIQTGPGSPAAIPPGIVELIEIKPTPNQLLVELYNSWLQSEINLNTIPEIAWGNEPTNLQSGFAISQVLGQVMDKITDKKESLEMAAAWHFGDILRAVEKFSVGATKFAVAVAPEEKGQRKNILEIGAEDVEGHYQVEVTISPELPTDQVLKMRMVEMARGPGATGQPVLPDSYLRREILEVKNPDEVEEELEKQMMEATDPIIQAHKRKLYREKWMKEQGVKEQEMADLEAEAGGMMGMEGQPGAEEMAQVLGGPLGGAPAVQGERVYPELEELL